MTRQTLLRPGADTLVSQLLAQSPEMASLFLELRLDCLGCVMARFCTLQEVSIQYEIPIAILINKINERIKTS